MLTAELIKGQAVLKDLTEDQVSAIATLSQNDENSVISQKFGEIHGQYDAAFKAVFGIEKPSGTKSTEFWSAKAKEAFEKAKAAGDTTALDQAKATIADLEAKIKAGAGDKELVTRLEAERDQWKAQAEDFKTKYGESESEWKTKLQEREAEIKNIEVKRLFQEEIADLKYKDIIPAELQKMAITNTQQYLLSQYDVDVVTDQHGNMRLEYSKDGVKLTNKDNGLNPYTSKELLLQQNAIKDIIDTGTHQNGTGTKGQKPGASFNGQIVDVSAAKSQVEATQLIKEALQKQGIPMTDPKWSEINQASWAEVQKMKLPLE